MKKQLKKLTLRKEIVRDLAATDLERIAGGISGTRICHTLNDNCGGGGGGTSGTATCSNVSACVSSGPAPVC
ncbi:MAG TPA: class I lanthipeptide [Kofleriaceae bacterium]|nr:class I lanthipeptide [Kofleriaceae bacterium]